SMAEFAAALTPWLAPPIAPSQPAVPPPATQRISCPHCHKPLKLAASQWGKRVRCSACQQPFTVNDVATLPVRPPPPTETVTPSSDRTDRRDLLRTQPLGVWLLA